MNLYQTRREQIYQKLTKEQTQAMLVFNEKNIRYLTGFTGDEAQLLLTESGNAILMSDSRFMAQIETEVDDKVTIYNKTNSLLQELATVITKQKLTELVVEGDDISASLFIDLKESLSAIELTLCHQWVEQLQMIKDEGEISLIKKAIEISEQSLEKVLPKITPGITEKEIANLLDFQLKQDGLSDISFETIVASGYRSAWPHGAASDKKIEKNELVTIDFGGYYKGYTSDITRTFAVGEVSDELKKIYHIVLEANRRATAKAKIGCTGLEVDRAARKYIQECGYGQYFGHGIGHGIGLNVHELTDPRLSFKDVTLQKDMIITIEPGIYVPGLGGVRIEDDVLITDGEPEVLTSLPKAELIKL
ncbi:aminopeptidase P family protein [Holzapfeliella sp. He02]|uniref:Aminopeptidase P family protein n=1 Tax=Holzapfeliella saturejae TaxID=3082953 RepID=A0ABU8SGU4_9LACO